MSKLGYASPRVVYGALVKVPVRWFQRAVNAWSAGAGVLDPALAEDGVWGPNTQARGIAMVSALRPASLTALRPSEDRRYAYIDQPLEQRLISLEVSASAPAATPPGSTGGTPLVIAPPAELEPQVSQTVEPWVYGLGLGAFILGAGVTWAITEAILEPS